MSYPLKDYLGIFRAPKQNPELKKFFWNMVTANLKLHVLIVLNRQHFEKNNQGADLVKSRSCSLKTRIVWSSRLKIFFVRKFENTVLAFLTCMIHRVVFWKLKVLVKSQPVKWIFINTVKNTIISPNFLVWKFCWKAEFPHSFRRLSETIRKLCLSTKISTPGN